MTQPEHGPRVVIVTVWWRAAAVTPVQGRTAQKRPEATRTRISEFLRALGSECFLEIYSNFHRVDLVWKCFSYIAKTVCGRREKTGSFIDRMSSFIVDISNLYLRS